jgi:hypothetical protein
MLLKATQSTLSFGRQLRNPREPSPVDSDVLSTVSSSQINGVDDPLADPP